MLIAEDIETGSFGYQGQTLNGAACAQHSRPDYDIRTGAW